MWRAYARGLYSIDQLRDGVSALAFPPHPVTAQVDSPAARRLRLRFRQSGHRG
nr:MAG TPA: hypothetical protein [Caudoviricetes sp.]